MNEKNGEIIIEHFFYARARTHAKGYCYRQTWFKRFNSAWIALIVLVCPYSSQAGAKNSQKKSLADRSVSELKADRKTETNPLTRRRLNRVLASKEGAPFVSDLILDMKNQPDPMVRQGAAQLLGNYARQPAVASALMTALINDANIDVRCAAALSLSLADPAVALVGLRRAARSPDAKLRMQAAYGLTHIENSKAKKILKRLKKDPDADVRDIAGGKGRKRK